MLYWRYARRGLVSVLGGVLILAGVVMLVLPGPGLLGIAAGMLLLSTEFASVHKRTHRVKEKALRAAYLSASRPWSFTLSLLSALSMLVAGVLIYIIFGEVFIMVSVLFGGVCALATLIFAAVHVKREDARKSRISLVKQNAAV